MKTNTISVYVVDDEPLILKGIISLFKLYSSNDFKLVGSHLDAQLAIEEINELQPQVLLLDIDMPDLNGFELIQQITYTNYYAVFITAYNEYAVKAFEINAIDYLLKPIDIERFQKTLKRINSRIHNIKTQNESADIESTSKYQQKIGIYAHSGYQLLDFKEIEYVLADNSYTHFHLDSGKLLTYSKNLKHVESTLPEKQFIRISRSAIVRLGAIQEFNLNKGILKLNDKSQHSVGITYKSKINAMLKRTFLVNHKEKK